MPALVQPVLPAGSLAGRPQPTLTTAELVLRPWRASDVPAVIEAYRDPQIQQWHARTMTGAEALAWVQDWAVRWTEEAAAGWAVSDGAAVLGRVDLRIVHLAAGWAEVAYWVLPSARGRGVATGAVRELSRWSFDDLGLHRLQLHHATGNEGSCRVAVKAGFQLEGTQRRQALHADGWHDMHLHARLSDDPV